MIFFFAKKTLIVLTKALKIIRKIDFNEFLENWNFPSLK